MKQPFALLCLLCVLLVACTPQGQAPSSTSGPVASHSAVSSLSQPLPQGQNSLQQLCQNIIDPGFVFRARHDLTGESNAAMRVDISLAFRTELASLLQGGVPATAEQVPDTYQTSLLMESEALGFEVMRLHDDANSTIHKQCLLRIYSYTNPDSPLDFYVYDDDLFDQVLDLWNRYTVENVAQLQGDAIHLQKTQPPNSFTAFAAEADGKLAAIRMDSGTGTQTLEVYALLDGALLYEQTLPTEALYAELCDVPDSQFRLICANGQIRYYNIHQPDTPRHAALPKALLPLPGSATTFDIDPAHSLAAVCSGDRLTWAEGEEPPKTFLCKDIPDDELPSTITNPQYFFAGCKLLRGGRYLFTTVQRATPGGQADSVLIGVLLYDLAQNTPHYIMGAFSPWNTDFTFDSGMQVIGLSIDENMPLAVDFSTMQVQPYGPAGFTSGPGTANYLYQDYAEVRSRITSEGTEQTDFYVNGAASPLVTVVYETYSTYLLGSMTENHILLQVQDSSGTQLYAANYR